MVSKWVKILPKLVSLNRLEFNPVFLRCVKTLPKTFSINRSKQNRIKLWVRSISPKLISLAVCFRRTRSLNLPHQTVSLVTKKKKVTEMGLGLNSYNDEKLSYAIAQIFSGNLTRIISLGLAKFWA